LEIEMPDRRSLGELGLAILIALPLVSFASPKNPMQHSASASARLSATADRLPGNGRISLLG
jgi:hypothetical protein